MADRDKPRRIAVGCQSERSTSALDLPPEYFRSKSRTEKELEPIAIRIAENAALMQRFRVAIGGAKNSRLVRDVMADVRSAAQELDPRILYEEQTTVIALLTKMVGHPGGQ